MALRELLAALEDEGVAEHELVQAESMRRAAQIITDARARAVDVCADGVAKAEATASREAEGILAEARAAAQLALRTARHEAVKAVRARAEERLSELPGTAAGTPPARACLVEALAALPRAVRARVHPADAAALSTGAAVELVADLDGGGAVVEDDDGRYVDNTYATRLANVWDELRVDLSRPWEQAS